MPPAYPKVCQAVRWMCHRSEPQILRALALQIPVTQSGPALWVGAGVFCWHRRFPPIVVRLTSEAKLDLLFWTRASRRPLPAMLCRSRIVLAQKFAADLSAGADEAALPCTVLDLKIPPTVTVPWSSTEAQ